MTNLSQHPLSAAFPAMQDDEYQALKDSIANIGVQNPITLFEGMVIDGWHRYSAANETGMDCQSIELGDVDPRDFVLAQNKARRNLTASQRAAAVTSVYQWTPSNIGRPRGELGSSLEKTNAELAAIAGTTTRTIQHAKAAHKAGLTEPVKAGAMTVKEAATIASGKPVKPAQEPYTSMTEPQDDEFNAIHILSEENDRLNDRLAVVAMDATEDERAAAAVTLSELRALIKVLTAELDAVKVSRDGYMQTNKELMAQCAAQRRQIDKLKK